MQPVIRLLLFALCVTALLLAQSEKERPKFSAYPVRHIYKGKPARPILSKEQRMFRTTIRLGAKEPVQLAGHYTVPVWGCGSGCTQFAIVDSASGRVFSASFSVSELPGKWIEERGDKFPERMESHPDSRLMKINGCLNEQACGFYDFLMVDGERLVALKKRAVAGQRSVSHWCLANDQRRATGPKLSLPPPLSRSRTPQSRRQL